MIDKDKNTYAKSLFGAYMHVVLYLWPSLAGSNYTLRVLVGWVTVLTLIKQVF